MLYLGCGGSSSGSALDYGMRGPEFDSHSELGFFLLFSFLSLSISGASLNRSLVEVQHNWFSNFQQDEAWGNMDGMSKKNILHIHKFHILLLIVDEQLREDVL